MKFKLPGPITNAAIIAAGPGIGLRSYLRKAYGHGPARKMNGTAPFELHRRVEQKE